MMRLDHLAVSAGGLADGVALVERALGVTMAPGGAHPAMGTHNRLVSLGDLYLEVIAVDPDALAPSRPRWFDLDRFAGPPRLTNWVVRCDDLAAELAQAPEGFGAGFGAGFGQPVAFQRGDYRWHMAVPEDGRLPYDGACPALMQWQGARHPTGALPEAGIRLTSLEITNPQAALVRRALTGRLHDERLSFVTGPHRLRATFATPQGVRVLG